MRAMIPFAFLKSSQGAAVDPVWTFKSYNFPGPIAPIGISNIAYSPVLNRYVISRNGGSATTVNTFAYSSDLNTWTSATNTSSSASWRGLTYGNGIFAATTSNSAVGQTSTDGTVFTSVASMTIGAGTDNLKYINGVFLAGTSGNSQLLSILRSVDGITWSTINVGASAAFGSFAYAFGKYWAFKSNNPQYTSTDSITWTSYNLPGTVTIAGWRLSAYAPDLNILVIVSSSTSTTQVATTTDGINWTMRSTPGAGTFWTSMAYGDGRFVVMGQSGGGGGGRMMTSTDGINWAYGANSATTINSISWTNIIFANGKFIAINSSNTLGNNIAVST
jgi:hypothetical protein